MNIGKSLKKTKKVEKDSHNTLTNTAEPRPTVASKGLVKVEPPQVFSDLGTPPSILDHVEEKEEKEKEKSSSKSREPKKPKFEIVRNGCKIPGIGSVIGLEHITIKYYPVKNNITFVVFTSGNKPYIMHWSEKANTGFYYEKHKQLVAKLCEEFASKTRNTIEDTVYEFLKSIVANGVSEFRKHYELYDPKIPSWEVDLEDDRPKKKKKKGKFDLDDTSSDITSYDIELEKVKYQLIKVEAQRNLYIQYETIKRLTREAESKNEKTVVLCEEKHDTSKHTDSESDNDQE